MKNVWLPALAALLFGVLFSQQGLGPLDFWSGLSGSILFLCGLAWLSDRSYAPRLYSDLSSGIVSKLCWGIGSAVLLYLVFACGNILLRLIFPLQAGGNIQAVYALKDGASLLRVTLLLALVIGPGEELFWRGAIQHRLSVSCGSLWGFLLAATIYAGVHIASGNPLLVMAAAVCGIYWGLLYWWKRSLLINCVSHTLWDLTVFLVLPF